MALRMKVKFPEIDTGPLYFISTHGYYQMDKYIDGTVPIELKVPENTLVIETASISDYCLFTDFFKILGPLFNNRARLLAYLAGVPPEEDWPEVRRQIFEGLSKCYFYLPGGKIANRVLEMTGGVYRNAESKTMQSERTGDYSLMGFYKYDANNNPRKAIFKKRYDEMISRAYGNVTNVGYRVNTSEIPFETYETMFRRINEDSADFKIIFFSSCGELQNIEYRDLNSQSHVTHIKNIQLSANEIWKKTIRVNYLDEMNKYPPENNNANESEPNENMFAVPQSPDPRIVLRSGKVAGIGVKSLTEAATETASPAMRGGRKSRKNRKNRKSHRKFKKSTRRHR